MNSAYDTVPVTDNVVAGAPTGSVNFYVGHTSIAATVAPGPLPRAPRRRRRGSPHRCRGQLGRLLQGLRPNSVGTWCFSAVYGGSATYAASADYASSATEDTGQCLLVNPPIGDAITSAPTASARAGFPFSFLVTTSGSPTPTIKRTGKASGATTSPSRHCSARGKRATP